MSNAAARIQQNRRTLDRVLPRLRTQTFRYPDDTRVVLGKSFAFDDDEFIAYPAAAFLTVEQAVAYLFELLDVGETLMLPSFLIDLTEPRVKVRKLSYGDSLIAVGQTIADTMPLISMTLERLRGLVGDLPPIAATA